jgi:hypothetical protein
LHVERRWVPWRFLALAVTGQPINLGTRDARWVRQFGQGCGVC